MNVKVIESQGWRAEVAPALGGNIVSLSYKGRDIYAPLESEKQLEINPYLHGAPILLPANRTAGAKFGFDGREYTLPLNEPATGAHLHGLVHRQSFTVKYCGEKEIKLIYENNGDVYPFPFLLEVDYTIKDGVFRQEYTVINTGKSNMPFTFALHTTFTEPNFFSVPIDLCQEKDSFHIPTGRYVPLNSQEQGYTSGSPSKGLIISGYYRACGHTAYLDDLKYTVSDTFDHWVLFNGRGESGLLCVEPQCGKVDGLNIKDGCKILNPNEETEFWTELKIMK
ncbi:MAG: hypothetical protein UHO61_04645 [Acutalibacteraceae bacterium]|nr:hypothetical protein [Acutalibacteraceae bacterium]